MEKMIKLMKDVKYKQGENVYNVNVVLSTNRLFLLEKSLPDNFVPMVGDRILWDFETECFMITEVEHLPVLRERKLYNYALSVDLP